MLRAKQGQRVLSRFSGDAVEAGTFEGDLQSAADRRLVINEKDAAEFWIQDYPRRS